jgi:drug/metabolite transporter (DMT)-like permease
VSSQPVAGAAIRHPTLPDYLHLIGLSLIWGSSFLAIKIAVEHGVPPLTVAAFRIGLGAALLLTIARLRGQAWPPLRTPTDARFWGRLLFLGVVGNSLPFFLISWGEQTTTSQLAGILMAIIPMLVVILAHFFTHDERLNLLKIAGVALGFAGVVVLVGVDALRGLGAQLLGQALIIGGCISYSLYGVTARHLPRLAPDLLIGVILFAGFIALLPFWLIIDRPWALDWQWQGVLALGWLGIFATGTGNLLYFMLMRRTGAGFASNNNYLVPPLALVYGYFILGEQPNLNAVVALVLILVGLAVQRMAGRPRDAARRR